MNFSSLVHGAVGAIVCDSLLLHELSSLSRVSQLGRKLVSYKYLHMKSLDLSRRMTDANFGHLCTHLRGIEVLYVPSSFLAELRFVDAPPPPTTDSSPSLVSASLPSATSTIAVTAPDSDMVASSDSSASTTTDHHRLKSFFTLLDNNCTTLRVLSQPHITQKETDRVVLRLIQQHLKEHFHSFTSLEAISLNVGGMNGELLNGYVETMKSSSTSPTTPQELLILSSLSSVDQYHRLNSYEIANSIKYLPQLKALFLCAAIEQKDWMTKNVEEDANDANSSSSSSSRSNYSSSVSFMSYFEIESGRSLIIPLWSNLLLLAINGLCAKDGMINPTRIELHLPHLLQFSLDQMDTVNLVDVSFYCPELIALRYGCACRIQPLELTLKPTAGFLYEGHRYKSAPSFLSSLRSSPKIRNLNYSGSLNILIDYSDSLTDEEKTAIQEKAKGLGLTSPFDMPSDVQLNEIRRNNRIFYYALSLLPCVNTLEMIEFAPFEMDLISEYCALFPNLRSISKISPWFFTPRWFRPHESEDESHYKYIHKRITKECEKKANRMYTPKDLNEYLCVRDHDPVSVFNFCARIELKLDTLKTLSSTSMFTQLKSIFLSSPVTIESSAVISLIFLTCQQLEHASLMQLDSINNTVFTSLPHDCIRPSLVTLRIKTPCDIHPDETFNDDLLNKCDLLPRLFPSLRHLEYLLMTDPNEVSFTVLECVPNAINSLCNLLRDQDRRRDSNDNYIAASDDDDTDNNSELSSSPRLIWPSLTTLIVRSCPDHLYQCESAEKRLAKIFSHRFSNGSSHFIPELTFISLSDKMIDHQLGVESALCWNLSPRREVSRTSMQPESSLTIIQASESSYPELIRPCFHHRKEVRKNGGSGGYRQSNCM